MTTSFELPAERLYRHCDLAALPAFQTTAELEDLHDTLGQTRALGALAFGLGMRHEGYNLYVMGSPGLGKHHTLRRVLDERSAAAPVPPDWCYVNNFSAPHKPRALRLPPGTGSRLQRDMYQLVRDLLAVLPAAFETDEYRARVQELNDEFKAREEQMFNRVVDEATQNKLVLIHTPVGYTIAPVKDGEVMEPAEFEKLPQAEQDRIRRASETVRQSLRQAMQQGVALQREHAQRLTRLNEDVARHQVDLHFADLQNRYAEVPEVGAFIAEVRQDILQRTDEIRQFAAENKAPLDGQRLTPFNRYFVNVLVDNGATRGAPVVHEDHPTYQNLMGRVEHLAQFGTLITDFTLIKGGALHRANGGSLVLDAHKLLSNPFAWDALKRALQAREVRIQSLEQMLSLASTISLEPQPIPLDVKVVLCGERLLYYLLAQYDPEFPELFKVEADFSEDMPRTAESMALYARLIATLQRREKLLPLQRDAVARLIEQAARRADDSEKLSLDVGGILDLLRESDHWAPGRCRMRRGRARGTGGGRRAAARRPVPRARAGGDPARPAPDRHVRPRGRPGQRSGGDRARQAELRPSLAHHRHRAPGRRRRDRHRARGEAGPAGPFQERVDPVLVPRPALRPDPAVVGFRSLVFEQSYGRVDGDSASAAELCALLSSLSGMPLRQDLAITGSVNQHGVIQPIGGVNEKIEGFFDICRARGLSGAQGVIIPASNVVHLMLRKDVVEAVRAGRFHVHAVTHIDEALELLSGMPAGAPDAQGRFPENSVNARAAQRLTEWAQLRSRFGKEGHDRAERAADGHE